MTPEVTLAFRTVLDKMLKKKLVDQQIYEFLDIKKEKPCNVNMLTKIHEIGIPGCPICSSINHPTKKIN